MLIVMIVFIVFPDWWFQTECRASIDPIPGGLFLYSSDGAT